MANKIKALLIDIDNTLLDFQENAKKSMDLAFKKRSMTRPDGFFEIFKRNNDILWKKLENKEITLDDLIKTRFNIIFNDAGIDLDGYEFELDFRKHLFYSAEKVNGAEEFLKYLSEKYDLYAASNGLQNQQENRLELSGLSPYFKDVFTSERMGASKPSKDFFDGCFNLLYGIDKTEVMLIGDSLTADISGGKDFGVLTCWFNYLNEENLLGIKPDYTIYSLDEIKKIL